MNTICATCKHWSQPDDNGWTLDDLRHVVGDEQVPRWGTCTLIDLVTFHERPTARAFTKDGSDYRANLHTREDFGCVEHEVEA